MVSLYFEPNQPMDRYLAHLRRIGHELGTRRWIAAGDSNAKCVWWGSPVTDRRGEELHGTLEDLGLVILNKGETPTFDVISGGQRYTSYVDITAASPGLLDLVDNWRVRDDLTSSDHNGISFEIHLQRIRQNYIKQTTRTYNTKKANWSQFREKLGQIMQETQITIKHINNINSGSELDNAVDKLVNAMKIASGYAIPKIKSKEILAIPWWSEELAMLKRQVATRKRRIRCAAPVRRQMVVEEYLKAKARYETEVRDAQTASWRNFCAKQDRESVWGESIGYWAGRPNVRKIHRWW
ncbi:unnamed protein product [Euphydryas editha]|uniref:Endonuclease/exonuclease/phosphatase domain-containing protein n=1 Tax=Euphydryas editha TaxID=104508 RepID=A0AAU9TE18_EUPED|nr:unnamed protein product [Euphydryas editha]